MTKLNTNKTIQMDYRLAARRGELVTFFQPIVDLKDGRLKALEARVRWHIGSETLSARQVLACATTVVERSELDFLIIEAALAAFLNAGKGIQGGLKLAVNLSPHTVLEANFKSLLENAINNAGCAPERLHLEIPLEAFELDMERACVQTNSLASAGLTIAIDHLNDPNTVQTLLDRCAISVVKLDETFVSRLPSDPHACETLSTIVAACNKRNVLVGAEGINRMERLHCLQGVGCDEGQGMLVCRPSRIGDLRKLLERGRCW